MVDDVDGTAPPDLPASAYVVLGMIGLGLRSGYEIKRAVDDSTRHFSALSFRQIYPELRRMEELGLVQGTDAPTGERRRTVYELTGAGGRALDAWLRAEDEVSAELRHSGLLKLFFADRLPAAERLRLVARVRRHHAATRAALAASQPVATRRARERGEDMPLVTLQFGIELSDFMVAWCDRLEEELARHAGAAG
jgi:DNA-binding PadR family transcriptional regulator